MSVVLAFEREEKRNWTLADQAAAINKEFERLDRAENRRQTAEKTSFYARDNAGRALIEAKAMLKQVDPDASFEAWCKDNINRSMPDIYKVMAIAGSDDPERAAWEERAKAAEGMAVSRSAEKARKQDNGVSEQTRSVQIALGLYRKMSDEDRRLTKERQEEIDQEERTDA